MVDLAGSECAKTANMEDGRSGQQQARERERMNINRSLLTLGRVVALLKEQSQKSKPGNVRIPYRDSKLTRILQQALGGNSKTVIIATLSPSVTAIEESISTLNYAQAAHGIINKPVSASYLSEATKSSSLLSGMQSSSSGAQSLEHWKEMEVRLEYMKCQVEEAKAALARKHLQQQELVDRAETAEAEKSEIEDHLILVQQKADSLKEQLVEAEEKQIATESELKETKLHLEQTALYLQATRKTEASLTQEALALLSALKQSVADGDRLHDLVLADRERDLKRREAAKAFNGTVAALLTDVKTALNSLSDEGKLFQSRSADLVSSSANEERQFLRDAKEVLHFAVSSVDNAVSTLESRINGDGGVVPTAGVVANDARAGVRKCWSLLETSEQTLMVHLNSTREQLTESGTRLAELELSHRKSATESLEILESGVASSKKKVECLVSSACAALEKARDERKKIRDMTRQTVDQWKQSMIESSDLVHKQSSTQRIRVEEAEATMTAEMQRHVNIDATLRRQGKMLESSHSASMSSHKTQKELLAQTQRTMESSHDKQTQLLNKFVSRLMIDVEKLVQNQVSEVMEEVIGGHATFLGNSSSLMSNHESIASSTLTTITKASELTVTVQEEAEVAKQNDANLISHLEETKSVLDGIETAIQKTQTQSTSFAVDTLHILTESEDLESADTKAREDLTSGGNQCTNFMSNSLLDDTTTRLSEQTETCNSIVSFTRNDIIEMTALAVNEMEKPRSELMSAFGKECSELEECIEEGLTQIKEKASVSCQIAESLQDKIQSIESTFVENTAEKHSAGIAKTESALLDQGTEHTDFTTRRIGRAGDGSAKAAKTAESFVQMDLSAFATVPDAPEKVKITFQDRLSSTPAEKDILAMATKLERTGASAVLQALSPNHERTLGNKKSRCHGGHPVPNFPSERKEPRSEHLS